MLAVCHSAWALGKLREPAAVDAFAEALTQDDPALEKARCASGYQGDAAVPACWWEGNLQTFVFPALAEIGGD